MYKVIVSQKKESTLNHGNETFLKQIPSQKETLAYCPPTSWSISLGLNENANSFFATRCCIWNGSGFPSNTVHKVALRSQMLLYQVLYHDEMKMRPIGPITADQRHGFGKINRRANCLGVVEQVK